MTNNGFGIKVSAERKRGLNRVGQHEVSHFIVAKVLGFKTGSISLEVTHPHAGHNAGANITVYNKLSDLDDIIDYLERRITVLFAGVIGESLSSGKIDNDYALKELNNGGQSDYDKSRELMQILNNIKFPQAKNESEVNENLDKISSELWDKAIKIILKEQEIIVGLANRLISDIKFVGCKVELSKDAIEDLPAIKKRFQ